MVQINVCLCLKVLANGKAESLHGCDWLDLCRVGIKEANTICVKCWIEYKTVVSTKGKLRAELKEEHK